jgi:tetratricopeptide (TPR) repeat protein
MDDHGATLRAIAESWSAGRATDSVRAALLLDPARLASPDTAAKLGGICSTVGELSAARLFYERAWQLAPERIDILKFYSGSLMAAGEFEKADALLERVVLEQPSDAEAWFSRAHAGRQSRERDLVGPIARLLADPQTPAASQVFLHYALGKCFDDLGDFDSAHASYCSGAALRRARLSYDADYDKQVLADIAAQLGSQTNENHGDEGFQPIFVVGLPRSGTTLLERIIGSHSFTTSIGESNLFSQGLMRVLAKNHPGRTLTRRQAVAASRTIQSDDLGRFYRENMPPRAAGAARVIDKMPLNFLYIALIRRALPGSRILVLRRAPMANCWSMFSTLFRKAYPWSYDFSELAGYYAAFIGLTDQLLQAFPETVRRVDYERLVVQPEVEVRAILEFLDLPWESGCMAFHESTTPTATASLEQVRKPVYQTSIDRWRNYPGGLQELAEALKHEGVCDV